MVCDNFQMMDNGSGIEVFKSCQVYVACLHGDDFTRERLQRLAKDGVGVATPAKWAHDFHKLGPVGTLRNMLNGSARWEPNPDHRLSPRLDARSMPHAWLPGEPNTFWNNTAKLVGKHFVQSMKEGVDMAAVSSPRFPPDVVSACSPSIVVCS